MGQRLATQRDSSSEDGSSPPRSSSLTADDATSSPLEVPAQREETKQEGDDEELPSAPRRAADAVLSRFFSARRPDLAAPTLASPGNDGTPAPLDVVVRQTPVSSSADEDIDFVASPGDRRLSASPISSTFSSLPSPRRARLEDDRHPLAEEESEVAAAPPSSGKKKLGRFRPSFIVTPAMSPNSRVTYLSGSDSLDSSSSDDDGEEELIEDWLDEPEDAILSPVPSARPASMSSSSSTSTVPNRRSHSHSSNSITGSLSTTGPAGSNSHHNSSRVSVTSSSNSLKGLAPWLGSPDEMDDEEDDEEPVLSQFLLDNMPVYEVMKQVQLFRNLSQSQQEQVVRALKPAKFFAGEVIVQQGNRGSRFYMIAKGEAVVTKTVPNANGKEQERMITHLRAGHYFGELALIYDDPRTATVRAVGDVELLYLTQEDFQHIGQVHLSLMLQQVPLLSRLNARDQDIVLSRLKPANFSDGEYIVRQGEEGRRFYLITRGEAIVSEKAQMSAADPETGKLETKPYEKELTRLYEGHVFGEMSLIYSEPRTASVRAVGPVKCLYLSKEDFDKCLLSDHFQRFIQEEYVEKATRRAMRLRVQQRAHSGSRDAGSTPQNLDPNAAKVVPPPAPTSPAKATETRKLVKQRLKNGEIVVNKYVIKGDLGKGTFGRVKLCQSEEDSKLYAVKIMHKTFVQRMAGKEDQLYDVLRREVAIMKKLNHRNVVKLVEVIDDPSSQKMYLVQEYVQHNLMDEVTKSNGLNEEVARKYMRDLLQGMHYLHFHKVIHRDIKPENILVTSDGIAKIADFGAARMVMNETETLSGAKGTPAFMAPEMFDIDAKYTGPAADVWSLGATLFMMVVGCPPWMADNEIELAERVQRVELRFPKDAERPLRPHLKNLVQRMLTKDPTLRISLNECFTHDWITKEGSEPLGMVAQEKDLTVSMDESERAIENIPEQIDQSLSESLAKAHLLVKTRQQGSATGGVVRTNSGRYIGAQTPVSGQLESRIPTTMGSSSSLSTTSSVSSSPSPNRSSQEEVSRIINAWRNHKRVTLMSGHKELSARARELLLEQKRMAFSVDRAKVTEIILPAAGPTPRSRYPSSASASQHYALSTISSSSSLVPESPSRSASSSSVIGGGVAGRSKSMDTTHSSLLPKKSSLSRMDHLTKDSGSMEGFGRTSFTSISHLSEPVLDAVRSTREDSFDERRASLSSASDGGSSSSASLTSLRDASSDVDLLKRSLSRKKDFLMVTSEVFRDEEGDYHSRKILFQARDHDFSVASRVPTHSNSGHDLSGRSSWSTSDKKKSASGSSHKSASNSSLRNDSHSSIASSGAKSSSTDGVAQVDDLDLDGIECVQVTDVDDDEDEEAIGGSGGGSRPRIATEGSGSSSTRHFHHAGSGVSTRSTRAASRQYGEDSDSDSDESDYSDVEDDVDVDATFEDLIGTPENIEIMDDEDLAPINPPMMSVSTPVGATGDAAVPVDLDAELSPDIVQVYVSSKMRENLQLRIRSGYAEAKGSRSYMEDRSLGHTTLDMSEYDSSLASAFVSLGFYGVYDGHGGDDTAVFLQKELHRRIFEHAKEFIESPVTSIAAICEEVDGEILETQNESMLPARKRTFFGDWGDSNRGGDAVATDGNDDDDDDGDVDELLDEEKMACHLQPISFSGSAAVFAIVAKRRKKRRRGKDQGDQDPGNDDSDNTQADSDEASNATDLSNDEEEQPTALYIANVGDCRAVIGTWDGRAIELTRDHKASLPEEQARIEASGGFVHNGRLDGILAISRGFGDLAHKQDGHLVATPDVIEHLVAPQDQFLLLSSDGLFDVLSSQQVVNFVARKLRTHGDVQLAAQELLLKAQAYLAYDNTSVIVVALNQKEDPAP